MSNHPAISDDRLQPVEIPGHVGPIPVRLALAPGEAFDSYFARVASANGEITQDLAAHLVGRRAGRTPGTNPDAGVIDALAKANQIDPMQLRRATLTSLPGHRGYLTAPHDRSCPPLTATTGWDATNRPAPQCSECIATAGTSLLIWQHPMVTLCALHRRWLDVEPLGAQPGPCRQQKSWPTDELSSGDHQARNQSNPASRRRPRPTTAHIRTQNRIVQGITAHTSVRVLGKPLDPAQYLQELWALTVLILQLALQPGAPSCMEWAGALQRHHATAGAAGRRWRRVPPGDLHLRSEALTAADHILQTPGTDTAVEALRALIVPAPVSTNYRLSWLLDATPATPILNHLLRAATDSAQSLAFQLQRPGYPRIDTRHLPHQIPHEQYRHHFHAAFGCSDGAAREFISLCIARRAGGAPSWTAAAEMIQKDPRRGTAAARTCVPQLQWDVEGFLRALDLTTSELANATDYRERERIIAGLHASSRWYRSWQRHHYPRGHAATRQWATHWLWTHWACGRLEASPGWTTEPTAATRGYYRRFEQRLTQAAATALLNVASTREKNAQ